MIRQDSYNSEEQPYEQSIRPYEVSLWNLQDDFITVLKAPDFEQIGTLDTPTMKITDDGTEELSFSIPMYIREKNGERVENPIWYNVINGNLIADMRKLKVIFNEGQSDNDIFEFLITKVTESHNGFELRCEVTAEGLAFHELGKQGTRKSLSYELYEQIYEDWLQENTIEKTSDPPKNNLSFWNEQLGFKKWSDTDYHDPGTWYYDIQMDWSSYAYASERKTDEVYEEGYAASWNVRDNVVSPGRIENYKEKCRIVELSNSNYYNITQDLAKEFGVFCKYQYIHDDNYHIIGRKIIYYNNFINDSQGKIDFSYPYQSSEISREMDGTDIVTKMYVETVEDDMTNIGQISIMNSEANLSKEDYLLNFDYMYSIGAISQDQYDEISKFEVEVHEYNSQLVKIDNYLLQARSQLPELEAAIALAKAGQQAALQGKNDNQAMLDALDKSDGTLDGLIESPVRASYLIEANDGKFYLNITEKGLIEDSLEIYSQYNYTNIENPLPEKGKLSGDWTFEYDEFGNAIKVNNITLSNEESSSNLVYLKYSYSPALYYKRILDIWDRRLKKDQEIIDDDTKRLNLLNKNIEQKENDRQVILNNLQKARENFSKLMGPALREGSWKPESNRSYNKRNGHYIVFRLQDYIYNEQRKYSLSLLWDTVLEDSEQDIFYGNNLNANMTGYPCIKINKDMLQYIQRHKEEHLCLIYSSIEGTETNKYYYFFDSECKLVFIKHHVVQEKQLEINWNGDIIKRVEVFPAIILTKLDGKGASTIADLKSNTILGTISINSSDDEIFTINSSYKLEESDFINLIYSDVQPGEITPKDIPCHQAVYLRFHIEDENLILNASGMKDDTSLEVSLNEKPLKYLEDYYYFNGNDNTGTYVTVKPEVLIYQSDLFADDDYMDNIFKNNAGTLGVFYYTSTANTAFYLDAKEVLKENSAPRVSYQINTSVFNTDFISEAYKKLNRIININDYELKFEDVQGYISSLELKLDTPWEDSFEVKNYKTKFEDLFQSIVASAEAMQKNANIITAASTALNTDGTIRDASLQEALANANLNYSFNNGALTIANDKGIEVESDGGIVSMRKGGIFTATDKNDNGDWIWNTGITPQGINAQMITVGQLDTNRIVIQAGDQVKFQLNDKGLYAYKNLMEDELIKELSDKDRNKLDLTKNTIDKKQYVVHNAKGLFLTLEEGASIISSNAAAGQDDTGAGVKLRTIEKTVDRVEISWNGLVLRNFEGEEVFSADPNTGDLVLSGAIVANGAQIGDWIVGDGGLIATSTEGQSEEDPSEDEEEGEAELTAKINPEKGLDLFGKILINRNMVRISTQIKKDSSNKISNDADNTASDSVSLISTRTTDNTASALAFYEGFQPIENYKILQINRKSIDVYKQICFYAKEKEDDSYTLKGSFFGTNVAGGAVVLDNNTKINNSYLNIWSNENNNIINSTYFLGETNTTAYRGDRGKIAYDHAKDKGSAFSSGLYKITTNDEGHVINATAVEKADITVLGIPGQDTTYSSQSASSDGTDISLVTTGEKYNWNAAYIHGITNKGSAFSNGLYKITTNSEGHVTEATAVVVGDITALGIPTTAVVTTEVNGLMSAADKTKLDGIESGAEVNIIEEIAVDDIPLTITNKAVNIDLSNKADIQLLQMIAPAYDEEKVYQKDEYCIYEYHLYKAKDDFLEAEAWNAEHWTQTTLCEELINLRQ